MLEELAVLNGGNRIHHHLGDIVVLYYLALGTFFRVKRSEQWRLQFVRRQPSTRLSAHNLVYFSPADPDNRPIRVVVRPWAGFHLDAAGQLAVRTHLAARFVVPR